MDLLNKAGMHTTAIAGITALMVLLCGAPPAARAGTASAGPPVPEAAGTRAGDRASIAPFERLTVERCIQIALRNSPDILAASHTVSASGRRIGQAWSDYYPQINLTGEYLSSKRSDYLLTLQNPVAPVAMDSYYWRAALTQNITDFGRTGTQVAVRQKEQEASAEELRDTTGQITFNVKSAYYGLLRAEKSRDVLKETVTQFEKQLEQAREFYEAGERSRFDVTNAEVELSNTKLKLIQAVNALRLARVTLNNAMGVPEAPEYTIEDTLNFQKYAMTFEEARERAFLNRPDIRSLAAKREAAEGTVQLARKGHLPKLSGSANYWRSGDAYPPAQDNWSVGVTLTIPFFTGFLTTHQVGEAMENLSAVRAKEEALRQNVLLTVQQAYIKLLEAEERVGVAELTVKQAAENYDLAHGRYEEGVGIAIEETNALVTLSNARMNVVAALADYKVAEAELRKAMGE